MSQSSSYSTHIDFTKPPPQQQHQQQSQRPIGDRYGHGGYDFKENMNESDSTLVSNFPEAQATETLTLGDDSFPQYFSPIWIFLVYILLTLLSTMFYMFIVAASIFLIPQSTTGMSDIAVRSFIIAATAGGLTAVLYKWTGATLDTPQTLLFGFCEMLLSRKEPNSSSGWIARASVLGKVLIHCIGGLIGAFCGVALLKTITSMDITTSDCAVDFSDSCDIRPRLNGIGDGEGRWMLVLHFIIVFGAEAAIISLQKRMKLWVALITRTFSKKHELSADHADPTQAQSPDFSPLENAAHVGVSKKKYVPWAINDDWMSVGVVTGLGVFVAEVLFSKYIGGGVSWLFYLVTAAYSNEFNQANSYIWPAIISGFIVFLLMLLFRFLSSMSAGYRADTLKSYKRIE